jgi:RHS repeat-associated protein
LTDIQRSNGVNAALTWDKASRLTRLQEDGGALADMEYTYNGAGEVIEAVLGLPLDPADYLVGEVNTRSVSYDDAGQIDSPGYVYDERGRLTQDPDHTYTWDGASRLTGVDGVTLTYNGLGNLMTRTTDGSTTRYYYNYALGLTPIVAEKDEGIGQFQRYYVWTPDGRLLYVIDATGGDEVYFYHLDRTGSTLALTDENGNMTDAYAYEPYGKLLHHQGSSDQPFTFVGQWGVRQEGSSGTFYHMRARYYDANTTRFVSREPLWPRTGEPWAINPYTYARNEPVSWIDVTGQEDWNPMVGQGPGHSMIAMEDGRVLIFGTDEDAREVLNDLFGNNDEGDGTMHTGTQSFVDKWWEMWEGAFPEQSGMDITGQGEGDWNQMDPRHSGPRFGHSMVTMPNGEIVLYGGRDKDAPQEDGCHVGLRRFVAKWWEMWKWVFPEQDWTGTTRRVSGRNQLGPTQPPSVRDDPMSSMMHGAGVPMPGAK